YTGLVQAGGTFSIDVPGSALLADSDLTVDASVTTTDAAGNSTTATTNRGYTLDQIAPDASIALNAITGDDVINLAEGASANVAITGTVGGDVQVGDTVTLTVHGTDYTGLVQAGGTFSIDVPGSALLADSDLTVDASVTTTDAAGNSTTANATRSYIVDTGADAPPPAAVVINDGDGFINDAEDGAVSYTVSGVDADATATVTFSDGNGSTPDVVVSGLSNGTFSVDLSSLADGPITATISVTDTAGNNANGSGDNSVKDTSHPTVAISMSDTSLVNGETALVTFTFSEAPTNFTNADVTVENGTLSAITPTLDPKVFTATFTPTAPATDLTNVITVGTDWSDAAGNPPAAPAVSDNYEIIVDPAPTVTVNIVKLELTDTEPVSNVFFTFSEPVTGFSIDDITVVGGQLTGLTQISPTQYRATLTSDNGIDVIGSVSVTAGSYIDSIGSGGAAGSDTVHIDTLNPTVAITIHALSLNDGSPTANVTFTFNEAVQMFGESDVQVVGGFLTGFDQIDANVWTAIFNAAPDFSGTGSVAVLANSYTDLRDNLGGGDIRTIGIDTQNPTVTVEALAEPLTDAQPSTLVTFTFSEAVTGFDLGDLTYANGTFGNFVQIDLSHYTAIFTADDGYDGIVTVQIGSGWTDLVGNTGVPGVYGIEVDMLNPTVASIIMTENGNGNGTLGVGETATVTITFSEPVTNFDASDLTVNGGTIGVLSSGDGGTTWTTTFTPTSNSTTPAFVGVGSNYTDLVGNLGLASAMGASMPVDTTAPSAPVIWWAFDDVGPVQLPVLSGGTTDDTQPTFLVQLNGAVLGDKLQLLLNGSAFGLPITLTPSEISSGFAQITFPFALPSATWNFAVQIIDAAGNAGTPSGTFALTIFVDTTAPTQTAAITSVNDDVLPDNGPVPNGGVTNDTSPTIGGTISAALAADETVAIYRDGAKVGVATVTSTTWTFIDGGVSQGTHTYVARVEDAAGNQGPASAPYIITVDTTPPIAPSQPDMTDASDDGVSNTDNITTDTTPTFTGTAEPGATVTLFSDGTPVGSAVAGGGGSWTITSSALTLGPHNITAQATDAAGNTSPVSSPLAIQIVTAVDNTPPAISGLGITEAAITFTASDPSGPLSLLAPFAAAFGSPAINNGSPTNLTPAQQGAPVSGTLQVQDAAGNAASVVGLYLGSGGGNTATAAAGVNTAMYGFGGNDSLTGNGGNDWLFGGTGNDVLNGGAGNDSLFGGAGNDGLLGGSGNDFLSGGADTDSLNGGDGNDTLIGGAGNDSLVGGNGNDTYIIAGGDGNDSIVEGANGGSADRLVIATGGAALTALNAFDSNSGTQAGNLVLQFTVNGGAAQQTTLTDHYAGTNAQTGVELINFDGGSLFGYQFGTGDYLVSRADPAGRNTGAVNLSGSSDNNFVAGENSVSDIITGGSGNDLIFGGTGNDTLNGGAGNDLLVGGDGNDTLNGENGNDWLIGGAGNDILNGGADNDVLIGGTGRDSLTGGSGNDIFKFNVTGDSTTNTATADLIIDFVQGQDLIDFSAIDASGAAGDQAFLWGGNTAATIANSVTWSVSGGNTIVRFDNTGNGTADMVVVLTGIHNLNQSDFIL
ncbi:MAG TPA: Ig-like domain-containing protein, partial [bacterium]|nr:Ig-like domain-containing protein [bacterium]